MTKLDDTDYETLINSMTVEDAVEVLRNTRCYGTMDIAKSVILRALEQQSCENCCNGNQEEKAKLCQKSYIAGMEHNCEDEQIIRIKKGTLKARTGKYVVYDVEWLKKHFDTTEAKIYGQSKAEGARGDIPLQQSVPKMPQPNERTETRECDYISRKLMHDMGATCIAARNENGDLVALGALDMLPSVKFEESEVKG